MNKKIISIIFILSLAAAIFCFASCHKESEDWTHKTFQGTVIEIWSDNQQNYFSMRCSIGEDQYKEYIFVISQDLLSDISIEIGDEIVVESDYNTNEHNGVSVPYPAFLIADAHMTDEH